MGNESTGVEFKDENGNKVKLIDLKNKINIFMA